MTEEVTLFKTWSSAFALRVVGALQRKGIQYKSVLENLSDKSDLFLWYNPVYKKVPVLIHIGRPILESLIILKHVDVTWKQYLPCPQDSLARSMAQFWAKFGDDKFTPSIWTTFISEGKEQEASLAETIEHQQKLEEELRGKRFFCGDNIGCLDITLRGLTNQISLRGESQLQND